MPRQPPSLQPPHRVLFPYMTIHRVFYYKLKRRKNEENEDCWPLLNTTGGAPGTKRYGILKTPGENTVNARAARQEKEEARKKKGSVQSSQNNKNRNRGNPEPGGAMYPLRRRPGSRKGEREERMELDKNSATLEVTCHHFVTAWETRLASPSQRRTGAEHQRLHSILDSVKRSPCFINLKQSMHEERWEDALGTPV